MVVIFNNDGTDCRSEIVVAAAVFFSTEGS